MHVSSTAYIASPESFWGKKERDRHVFNSLGRKEGPRFLSRVSSSNPPGLFDSWTSSLSTLANTVVAVGTGGALEAEPSDSSGPNPRAGENGPNFGTAGGGGGDSLRRASVGEYESDSEHTSEYTDEDSVLMDEDYQVCGSV
ncbi:hypothetical protein SARC_13434 [Sphaeroforma arctica JP610]|uniref:Uncharacterized protein n=1 Tax=Sphaeroforma arctica JP610 TaxID=667725 RepID=A0A0L0FD59_9EUKA|nr:hypothetical protein SARC_13434 [Sphaeroforma arctica JP610]KNC74008.1 hypothetical protein SARC_13434 [Sphaeroforma arctica JP610]|eukprot:XP_014147910.1 hypothetical protein SARC_13434 [Sphaeroforma arctica JP610]